VRGGGAADVGGLEGAEASGAGHGGRGVGAGPGVLSFLEKNNLESRELRFALTKDPLLPRKKRAASSPCQGEVNTRFRDIASEITHAAWIAAVMPAQAEAA